MKKTKTTTATETITALRDAMWIAVENEDAAKAAWVAAGKPDNADERKKFEALRSNVIAAQKAYAAASRII